MKKLLYAALALGLLFFHAMSVARSDAQTETKADAQPAAQGQPLKIGVMMPLSGPWSHEGQSAVNVLRMLAAQINQAGGVEGRLIELEVVDDGGDTQKAVELAPKLAEAGVMAVIGPYASQEAEATQSFFAEHNILQISPSSFDGLTEKGIPTFLRINLRNSAQVQAMADSIKALGVKKAALVREDTLYAKNLGDALKTALPERGVEVLSYDVIPQGRMDNAAMLAELKAKEPEMLVFLGNYPEAAAILRQKKEMNWPVAMLGSDGTNNRALVDQAGLAAAEGYYFISPHSASYYYNSPQRDQLKDRNIEEFFVDYNKLYGTLPSSVWALMAGDALGVIVRAVESVPNPDAVNLAEYLKTGLKDYNGLTGPVIFDAQGERIADEIYKLYQVDTGGAFTLK